MDKLTVIKIGGNVIDDSSQLKSVLESFSSIDGLKILIHGGGKRASEMSRTLGIEPQMVNGRRITSAQDLEIVTMVYAGLINKSITVQLQSLGCNALGLSGADGNSISSNKRPIEPIDFGFVGDVKSVNSEFIKQLLEADITPVFCAITHNGSGQLLNTNADTIAAEVAKAMSNSFETELIYCFEKNGVLTDVEDENSVIPVLSQKRYQELKANQTIHSGMLPKLDNCFMALESGVTTVIVGNTFVIENRENLHTKIVLNDE